MRCEGPSVWPVTGANKGGAMSDTEPIGRRPSRVLRLVEKQDSNASTFSSSSSGVRRISFDRNELNQILSVYGRKVADGEWRDYAIDAALEKAVFSIFRRASEFPLYRIEKNPKLKAKQGAYSVVTASGHIVKRGHDLAQVLKAIDRRPRLVVA
jgi:hypothetical protein